jgi:hypothetical protein
MDCWHQRCNSLCLDCQSPDLPPSSLKKRTIHHSTHLRLLGGSLGQRSHRVGRNSSDRRLGNTNLCCLDGHSRHHNDPAVGGVPT